MITNKGIALGAMLLTLTLSAPSFAQRPRNGDNKGGQAQAPANYNPKPASKEEFDAFSAVQNEQNPTQKIALADQFLTKYPNSELNGYIQRFRMDSYTKLGKHKEAIAAAEEGLALETKYMENMIAKADADAAAKNSKDKKRDKNAPPPIDKNSEAFKQLADSTEKAMMYYYQNLMSNYQNLNDPDKTVEWGKKALSQDPDDVLALVTVSSVMAARPANPEAKPEEGKPAGYDQKEAEDIAKRAQARVAALVSSPAGASIPADAKASLQATTHQTLGRVHLNNKKFGDAQKEYTQAIAAKKDDPESYYFLGLALAQDKPPKIDDAMEALGKAVFLKGATEKPADDLLKQLYQNKNKSLDGYDEFVKQAGAKIK